MLGARLLQLIQAHAGPLSREVVDEIVTSDRTPAFRRLNAADVETRVSAVFYGLGKWLDDGQEGLLFPGPDALVEHPARDKE